MNDPLYGISLGFLSAICFFVLINIGRFMVAPFNNYRKVKKSPNVLEVKSDSELCSGHHTWERIELVVANKNVPAGETMACCECGLIVNTKFRLNKLGLEVLNRQVTDKQNRQFENEKIEKEIKYELDLAFNKFTRERGPGITDEYLRKLFDYAIKSAEDVTKKVITQMKEDSISDIITQSGKKED